MFHETLENGNMFKKSLLAMTIAGASLTATAGVLTFDITETAATATAVGAEVAAVNLCALVAAEYSATIDLNAQTPDNAAVNDTLTVNDNGTAGIRDSVANTVTYTGPDACTVDLETDVLVAASAATYSAEGAAENGVTVTATLITGVGGVTAEDTIIITVSGGVVDEDASAGATLTSLRGVPSTFTLLGVVGNTILFTVDAGEQVAREVYDLAGLVVTGNVDANALSLSAATQNTANVQYDTSPSTELVVLEAQYTAAVENDFDGIIDVATSRLTLALNADDAFDGEIINEDTIAVMVEENTANGNLDSDEVVFTVEGEFSWMAQLDTSDDGNDITSAELAAGLIYGSHTDDTLAGDGNDTLDTVALNDAMDTLTVTIDTTVDSDVDAYHTFGFDVPAAGTTSFNEQSFTLAASSFDGEAEAVLAAEMTVGEWTLNGSVVQVPYMPFGPNTQPILRHTNIGVQTGDISARYMLEGVNTTWQDVGVVVEDAAPGMVNLLTPVMDAIEADAGVTKGKVAIEITTTVPGEDVTVFAAAKITTSDSDRLSVGAF
ncbi:MAG: hypothetical protein ACI936_000756 [Paraglaciecola sp.]